jgi:hypothetical protein
MLLAQGSVDDKQIVPARWIDDIAKKAFMTPSVFGQLI